MKGEAISPPHGEELTAASGAPYRPVPIQYRPPHDWHPVLDGELASRYGYTDAMGVTRYEILRFHVRPGHPSHPEKQFLSRRRTPDGGWAWGLEGMKLVLYRLPRVLEAARSGGRVYVVEGEQDVHALEAGGLVATCNPLGALQWLDCYAEALGGADVVVVPDNDRPGMVHAGHVIESLRDRARSVRLLLLPGLGPTEDAGDWLARGHTVAELDRLATAAPLDPSPAEVARLLDLPPNLDPRESSAMGLRALLRGASGARGAAAAAAPAAPGDAPFARSLAAFRRLGVELAAADGATSQTIYCAVTAVLREASPDLRPLLEDASLLDRACSELLLFAPLLRALDDGPGGPPSAEEGWVRPATVRVLRTRWDWVAFGANPALSVPPAGDAAYALHLPPEGSLRVRRLHPLALLVLEACAIPCTATELHERVAEAVEGAGDDPARLAGLVDAQLRELSAAGLLRVARRDPVEHALEDMHRLLFDGAAPATERRAAGLLTRAVAAALDEARTVREGIERGLSNPYELYQLDMCVDGLERVLSGVRGVFAGALDGYWGAGNAVDRLDRLAPLLEALDRTVDHRAHVLPPLVFA
jgi:hypothetical protein